MNRILASLAVLMLVVGCSSEPRRGDSSTSTPEAVGGGVSTSGAGIGDATQARPVSEQDRQAQAQPAIDISRKVVYFDFDSSAIKASELETIANHARYLAMNPSARVRLEGHADERGTREYNIALGERRANAVRDALLLRGAMARQITVVSYGEERPVDPRHNEEAWARNRRVEFVYESR